MAARFDRHVKDRFESIFNQLMDDEVSDEVCTGLRALDEAEAASAAVNADRQVEWRPTGTPAIDAAPLQCVNLNM